MGIWKEILQLVFPNIITLKHNIYLIRDITLISTAIFCRSVSYANIETSLYLTIRIVICST